MGSAKENQQLGALRNRKVGFIIVCDDEQLLYGVVSR